MYGLPRDFDPAFFLGRIVQVMSFTENTVFLGFDEHVSITVKSSLEHQCGPEQTAVQEIPLAESKLMQLVGKRVMLAEADYNGTLTLVFDNGHALRFFDDSSNYESYSINNGKDEIIV